MLLRRKRELLGICCSAIFLLTVGSCDLINPDEQAPVYIQVDSFAFDPSPTLSEMGPSTSTKITDVWVFVDNEVLGVYELPAFFPVLAEGDKPFVLIPGIFLNGIGSTRSPYPFYEPIFDTINFIPGTVVRVPVYDSSNPNNTACDTTLCFNYNSNAECKWCEDFEGSGFSLSKTSASDTSMYQTPYMGDNTVFEGLGSGVIYVDNDKDFFEISSTTDYELPKSGNPVYLELDYKIDEQMVVGMFVTQPGSVEQFPVITLNPTNVWKKIYIELGRHVRTYPNATGFKIFFGGFKDPQKAGTSKFYIDNIKLVHN
jgi:hypothetical protein